MRVDLSIAELGDKLVDFRDPIPGDSYNWGPLINPLDIQFLTFHHSVTPQTAKIDNNWQAECIRIANSHLAQGWGGIGYRFVICSNGVVAYVGDLSRGGSAVANNNHRMFSAVLVGDFTKENPTDAQIDSAHKLAKAFLYNMPQYPNLNSWDQIKGHKEFNPTACPGNNWKDSINGLYQRIKNNLPINRPPVSIPTQPKDSDRVLQEARQILFGMDGLAVKLAKLRLLLR